MMRKLSAFAHPARPVLALAFAFTLLVLGCKDSESVTGSGPSAKAVKTDFRLKTLEGRPLGPKDFPGQVVVLDFWATFLWLEWPAVRCSISRIMP